MREVRCAGKVPVLVVDVRIVLDELLDDVQVAHRRREVQARALVVVGGVDGGDNEANEEG